MNWRHGLRVGMDPAARAIIIPALNVTTKPFPLPQPAMATRHGFRCHRIVAAEGRQTRFITPASATRALTPLHLLRLLGRGAAPNFICAISIRLPVSESL